jgi:hypothetical protein
VLAILLIWLLLVRSMLLLALLNVKVLALLRLLLSI